MLVSRKRTSVNLFTTQTVARAEDINLGENPLLQLCETQELGILVTEGAQITRHKRAH